MDSGRFDEHQSSSAGRWSKKNTPQAAALGRSRGGLNTKIHAAVDALGNAVHLHLSAGQEADCVHFDAILQDLPAEVAAVVADKAYDTNDIIEKLETRGAQVVIPAKANRKEPRILDENLYEDRNKVERFFLRIKQHRAVATRYDKTAASFLSTVCIAAILDWMK